MRTASIGRVASLVMLGALLSASTLFGSPAAGRDSGARYLDGARRAVTWVRSALVHVATALDKRPVGIRLPGLPF